MVGTRLLVAVVLSEGVLLVAVLLSVAGWIAGAGSRRRRDGRRLADQRRILGAYLAGAAPPEDYGRRLARLPWRLRIRLLVDAARMVEGADRASMRTLAAEAGVLDRAERWCRSRRWYRRMAGARLLPAALRCCADEAAEVRAAAALLAAAMGGPEASAGLLALLADPQPEVRAAAACGLGRLSSWAAAPALARMLADPAWDVRKAAALSLRQLGPPGAMYLRRALTSSAPLTVGMARQVLDLPEVSLLRQPVEVAA